MLTEPRPARSAWALVARATSGLSPHSTLGVTFALDRSLTVAALTVDLAMASPGENAEEVSRRMADRADIYRRAEEPVLADLRANGIPVEHIEELCPGPDRTAHKAYKHAVPILVKWLPKVDEGRVKWTIASALAVPWARGLALQPLLAEFRRWRGETPTKDGLGFAIRALADESVFDELVSLLKDRQHGSSRCTLVAAIARMAKIKPAAIEVLIEALADEDLTGQAVMALGKLKVTRAAPFIKSALQHKHDWVRKEAKSVLRKLEDRDPKTPVDSPDLTSTEHSPSGLAEWSTNIDLESVGPLLASVSASVDRGLSREAIGVIESVLAEMGSAASRTWKTEVGLGGQTEALWLIVRSDPDGLSGTLILRGSPGAINGIAGPLRNALARIEQTVIARAVQRRDGGRIA